MRRALPAAVLALFATLYGCGSATAPADSGGGMGESDAGGAVSGHGSPSSPSPESADDIVEGCAADDPAIVAAATIAELDLDGDGSTEPVRWTGADAGPCGGLLVATVDGATTGVDVGESDVQPRTARVVDTGQRQLLVVHGAAHPRGGHPLLLLGQGERGLGEVKAGGEPVLDFVATDGGAVPATAKCLGDGRIATFSATTAKPPGVVLAWDVQRTTYQLHGTQAIAQGPRTILSDQADPVLREKMPQLFDVDGYFRDCTVRSGE